MIKTALLAKALWRNSQTFRHEPSAGIYNPDAPFSTLWAFRPRPRNFHHKPSVTSVKTTASTSHPSSKTKRPSPRVQSTKTSSACSKKENHYIKINRKFEKFSEESAKEGQRTLAMSYLCRCNEDATAIAGSGSAKQASLALHSPCTAIVHGKQAGMLLTVHPDVPNNSLRISLYPYRDYSND